MKDQLRRWEAWPVASGAFSISNDLGYSAGHVKFVGCSYGWIIGPKWGQRELEIWRLFAIRLQADGSMDWAFGSLEIKWRRASWRYSERLAAINRRKAKPSVARKQGAAS